MDDLDGALRRATAGRLAYDRRASRLVVHGADGTVLVLPAAAEAVRNAMQSAVLAAVSSAEPVPASTDGPLAAGARALVASYDADARAVEGLVRRCAARYESTAAARSRGQTARVV